MVAVAELHVIEESTVDLGGGLHRPSAFLVLGVFLFCFWFFLWYQTLNKSKWTGGKNNISIIKHRWTRLTEFENYLRVVLYYNECTDNLLSKTPNLLLATSKCMSQGKLELFRCTHLLISFFENQTRSSSTATECIHRLWPTGRFCQFLHASLLRIFKHR